MPTILLLMLLLWIPQNAAHELAHAAMHRLAGDKIVRIWPFPGFTEGHFSFASMRYHREGTVSPFVDGLCSSIPQIANTIVLVGLMPLHLFALTPLIHHAVCAWGLVNFIDGAVNLSTFYRPEPHPSKDGWQTARHWQLNHTACRVFTAGWQILFGLHVALLIFG